VVLAAIREHPDGILQPELQALTDLRAPTVNRAVAQLTAQMLVEEVGHGSSSGRGGRPAKILRVKADGRLAIGVHLDPNRITQVLMNLGGKVEDSWSTEITPSATVEEVVAVIAEGVARLLAPPAVDRSIFRGVGVAAPGPIDFAEGVVFAPVNLPAWPPSAPVEQMLAARLPTEFVKLDNDATAAAVGERLVGVARGCRDFVYVYMGSGIGGGVCLDGRIHRGPGGNAAEIGHTVVQRRGGPLCRCGSTGCVEALSSPRAIVAAAAADWPDAIAGRPDPNRLDDDQVEVAFDRLCAAARNGNSWARQRIATAAEDLAAGIVNAINTLDVRLVVLGGPHLVRHADLFLDVVATAVREYPYARSVHSVNVATSTIEDAAAVGAAALVFEAYYAPNTALLTSKSAPGVRP
jgi:predicted NBD/HSP70 family sugar kinase